MFSLRRLWRVAFFSEMNPIIARGETHSLQAVDLPDLPTKLDPRQQAVYESEIDWTSGPRFLRTLLWASRRLWTVPTVFYLCNAALNLSGPVLVNHFIKRLQAGVDTRAAMIEALLYGLGIGLSGLSAGLAIQHYFYHSLQRNQVLINVINTKLFRHALNLAKGERERTPIGDIVNHMSSDTDAVSECPNALSDLMYCTIMIVGAIGLLFHYLGPTAWVAVVLLGLLGPVTRKVGREFTRFDKELMRQRDHRVSLMSQILNAIRLVKYFGWEGSVAREVQEVRALELRARRRIARAELFVTLIYVSVGTLVLFSVFTIHSWRGGAFDPALVFTCVSLFSLLEDPFAFISRVVSMFISAKVASERIASFLSLPAVSARDSARAAEGAEPLGLILRDVGVRFGDSSTAMALRGVSLQLAAGQSLAVVGAVGSGKSTLMHALLGELPLAAGEFWFEQNQGLRVLGGRLGYVPQEAYILNGSLRENLTFGNDCSNAEVERAVDLAGLRQDIRTFSGGLQTEIGEKGVNLSGGQRQRLSLARAILHRPQLVILDDPLSAVDASMETYLAEHLLFGEWSRVTRVVVTHRLAHLRRFDRIAFLQDGELIGYGTFDELFASSAEFRAYLEEYARAHAGPAAHASEQTEATTVAAADDGKVSRITEDEDREFGAVRGGVYLDYVLSLGGENRRTRPWVLLGLALAAASGTVFPLLQKTWLAFVANAQGGLPSRLSGTFLEPLAKTPLVAIYVYGGLGLLVMAAALVSDLFWLRRGLVAGRNIHDGMLRSILGATIRFFDSTPVGRVLQRFSRDMEAIDVQLQWAFENSMKCFAQVVITLTLIVTSLPWVWLAIAPVLAVYYRVQRQYRASAREAKRLDSISRSPRYAHFKETLQGLTVIRAYGKREWFLQEFFERLHHSQRMFYGHYMVNRWFSSRIPVIGGLVSLCTAVAIVAAAHAGTISAGMAGLLAVYSLSFWGVLNWGIRIWSEVEARMTSMERVKTYSRLPQEPSIRRESFALPSNQAWPQGGEVQFDNVNLRYAPHLPLVLKGLSFTAKAGTKVGIVGRTGSGKSTIFQALYRFIELESGCIRIDGIDIATLPLARLRRALAIIPQDPTLFMGTLRSNLDRYGEYDDAALWAVLERTCLGDFVRAQPLGLQTLLTENGANLSQGQRQLLCLARALLTNARVIILDEATASVDVQTDAQVQRVVRESCAGVTMLIIAHRLGTVRDCDQILEIAQGRLSERRVETESPAVVACQFRV